ncbi:MAG: hypothetical protein O7A69_00185 [SAR324 cluster bacterium]|nr:hypothetical protein [SAR324 cluster bacterium]
MSYFTRQHYISLVFLAGMILWLGVTVASTCDSQHMRRFGVVEQSLQNELKEMMDRADHYEERYLDWGGGADEPPPPHLAVPRL